MNTLKTVDAYEPGQTVTWRALGGVSKRGTVKEVVRERVPRMLAHEGTPGHSVPSKPAYVIEVDGGVVVRAHHEVQPA